MAFFLDRPIGGTPGTDSSARVPADDSISLSCSSSTQKGMPDDGHSYEGTVVKEEKAMIDTMIETLSEPA